MGGFGPAAGERSGSIWRNRDFRLVWLSQTLSDLGSGVSTLAYPLLALALTRSTVQAGAVSALSTIPYLLLGLPAGALADRWDRRRLMIVCDAGSAVVLISIPVALALGHLTVEQLYATALLNGVLRVFFGAGESACLPNVVPSGRLAVAVAAQQATSAAGGVVSPSLGGALFEVLRGLPFGADAVSYLVSVVALSLVRTRFDEGGGPVRRGRLRDEIREGLAWLWSHPTIRVIAVTAAGLQLALSGVRLTVIVAAQQAHASPASIGLIFSAAGVGGVVGSALASRLSAWLGTGRTVLAVAWAQPLLWLLLALAHGPVTIAPVLLLFSISLPVFGVTSSSYRLAATPDHLRGRVGTAFTLIALSTATLGPAAAGLLLGVLSPRSTSLVLAGWVLAVVALATWRGGLLAADA